MVSICLSYVGKSLFNFHMFAYNYYAALSTSSMTTRISRNILRVIDPPRAGPSSRRPRPFTADDNASDSVLRTKSGAIR